MKYLCFPLHYQRSEGPANANHSKIANVVMRNGCILHNSFNVMALLMVYMKLNQAKCSRCDHSTITMGWMESNFVSSSLCSPLVRVCSFCISLVELCSCTTELWKYQTPFSLVMDVPNTNTPLEGN